MPVVVCQSVPGLPVVYANGPAKTLFGTAAPRDLADYCRFHTRETFHDFELALHNDGAVGNFDAVVLSAASGALPLRIQANCACVDGGEYAIVYFAAQPRRDSCATDTVIRARGEEIFRTVADNLDELVYISDLETHELKFVSRSLAAAMKCQPDSVLGQPCWAVLHRGQAGPCPFCPMPRIRDNNPGDASYIWELHNSVSGKWYMVKDAIIEWIDGGRAHLGTLVDITYRKQYEEQLKRFAATDAMTDVYNRKWGYGKLEELFREEPPVRAGQTLCFIDVDRLKAVNDRLGHAAGDEMIVNIIRTIFSCIRKDDFIVRWGGDEFIVFLNCSLQDAAAVISKIQFGLDHFNNTRGKSYALSISIGLADFAEPCATLDELISVADARMYADKMERRHACEGKEPLAAL